MAILDVREAVAREGEQERTDLVTSLRQRYSRTFTVRTTGPGEPVDSVLAAPGIPALGGAHALPGGPVFVTRRRAVQRRNTRRVWDVTVDYNTLNTNAQNPNNPTQNPLERPPDVRWEDSQLTKVFDIDSKGKPVTNSAKEKFDPPPETEQSEDVLVIERNQEAYTRATSKAFKNKVNKFPFWGEAKGIVRCIGITAVLQFENEVAFWRVTYRFQFRDKGWNPRKLYDEGFYELVPDPANPGQMKQKQILGADDLPVPAPVPLDGNGARLALPAANPAFVEYDEFEEVDFGPLELE